MCHFVTAILPSDSNIDCMNVVAAKHHRWFTPIENTSVQAYLHPKESYFSTLSKRAHCDCGVTLGWYARNQKRAPAEIDIEAETQKLQRKGWSKTKIVRWVEAKEKDRATWISTPQDLQFDSMTESWEAFVHEVLAETSVSFFGLLLHWYRGGLESRISLQGRKELALTRMALATMEEDILYVFYK